MKEKKIDWVITLVPFILISGICLLFIFQPLGANAVLIIIRNWIGHYCGVFYLLLGLGIFIFSLFLSCSRYGDIVLGKPNEKPRYNFFTWGSMMFTCGLAADILFYSFSEWILYALDDHVQKLGSVQEWAGVFPLFHWSLIPWAFYLVLAVAFGFMMHVRKQNRQRFSQACYPLFAERINGWLGSVIDLLAVFALLAGTATTFSVATPLLAQALNVLFGFTMNRTAVTLLILLVTCVVYTYALLHGIGGISILSKVCVGLFFGLLIYVFLFGGQGVYILETGLMNLGTMLSHFLELATYTDPLRETGFPQNWTIYYWAYWMVWCVAAPFFIGRISQGRTIRQTIVGGYVFGVGATISSFLILGNYGMGMQMKGIVDFLQEYGRQGDIYASIIALVQTLPWPSFVLGLLILTMIAFYATSFDSIAYIASCYSYKKLEQDRQPDHRIELLWCILLILLPIGLVFSKSSMSGIQSVSIIAALPLGVVIVCIVLSLWKDIRAYTQTNKV